MNVRILTSYGKLFYESAVHGICISSYDVYRTEKPCYTGRTTHIILCVHPCQYSRTFLSAPSHTAHYHHSHELHFISFQLHLVSKRTVCRFSTYPAYCSRTVSHRFLPAPSGIPSAARSLCLSRKSFVVAGSSDRGTGWRIL